MSSLGWLTYICHYCKLEIFFLNETFTQPTYHSLHYRTTVNLEIFVVKIFP